MYGFETSHEPTDVTPGTALPIWRPSGKGNQCCYITSSDWIGVYTHWSRGRTIPCHKTGCEPCKEGCGRRWIGFLGVWSPRTGGHRLWAFPAGPLSTLAAGLRERSTLRGLEVIIMRGNNKPNGPVLIRLVSAPVEGLTLPDEPDILACLGRIWQTADEGKADGKTGYSTDVVVFGPKRAG